MIKSRMGDPHADPPPSDTLPAWEIGQLPVRIRPVIGPPSARARRPVDEVDAGSAWPSGEMS
jgi:hypothetical protein